MPRLSRDELKDVDRKERHRQGMRERMRRYRDIAGGRYINTRLEPDIAMGMIYLKQQWGMKTNKEVMEAAVRFLTLCTRSGLQVLPQSIDD